MYINAQQKGNWRVYTTEQYFPSERGVLFILFPRIYSQIIKYKVKNFYISRKYYIWWFLKIVCYRRFSLANTTVVYISTLPYFIPAVPHLSLIGLHRLKFKKVILAFSWVFDNEELITVVRSIKIKVRTDTMGMKVGRFIFWL